MSFSLLYKLKDSVLHTCTVLHTGWLAEIEKPYKSSVQFVIQNENQVLFLSIFLFS